MDKTININIAGTLFQIDEEAFRILRDYLQAINNRFKNVEGGHETIEDIESRIAEIFLSHKGVAGVISKENVETMISIIGKPEDFDHEEAETTHSAYSAHRKRMYRNPDDTIISGVCSGIGAYLNTDPVLFRILFVLFTVFFGVGFLVYIVLWIALPPANTIARKREMYGNDYQSSQPERQPDGTYSTGVSSYKANYNGTSRIGNAFNEIFRAIGRVCYIILRIFLIIIGIALVLAGFLTILSFVMVFLFKFPGSFSSDGVDFSLSYFPDFLNYIVSPSATPWIIALTLIAIALPMLALIYWGVKMIFWFKAKDGIFNLAGFVLWVLTIAALAIILLNEGTGFAETARSSSQSFLPEKSDTLYVKTINKIADLKFDKELAFNNGRYTVFINDEKKELFIKPCLKVSSSENGAARVDLKKRSSGRDEADALKKTGDLQYNYRISGDTLLLDEYFTIPSGRKWSADNVGINIYLHKGTVIKFDANSKHLIRSRYYSDNDDDSERWIPGNNTLWIISDDGFRILSKNTSK
jgi:phage shock protein PspC (stress-responsive transcriptional regulator)